MAAQCQDHVREKVHTVRSEVREWEGYRKGLPVGPSLKVFQLLYLRGACVRHMTPREESRPTQECLRNAARNSLRGAAVRCQGRQEGPAFRGLQVCLTRVHMVARTFFLLKAGSYYVVLADPELTM